MKQVEKERLIELLQAMNEKRTGGSESLDKMHAKDTEARIELLTEWPAYLDNDSALANLEEDDKIISVYVQGLGRVYPGFQFDKDGVPLSVIETALEGLPLDDMSHWEALYWFVAGNPWLEGKRPVDVLEDVEKVREAATKESEEIPT